MSLWDRVRRATAVERMAEERIYELVMREIESGERRDGLWLKAVEASNGDEKRAKILYIKYRVQSLRDEISLFSNIVQARQEQAQDEIDEALNGYDANGYTPLMLAVLHRDAEHVRLLLSRGANPKLRDGRFGTSTALDMALLAHRRSDSDSEQSTLQEIVDALRLAE